MSNTERGTKIEINETTLAVVNAHNALLDAKKTGGVEHGEAMKELIKVLADNKGAVEIFSAIQE